LFISNLANDIAMNIKGVGTLFLNEEKESMLITSLGVVYIMDHAVVPCSSKICD
jgi:hypothetical protein